MKYLHEFRNGEIARALAREIAQVTTRPWKIMEVCLLYTSLLVSTKYQIRILHGLTQGSIPLKGSLPTVVPQSRCV